MKFDCAYTDESGLTVSLSISAPFSYFEPLFGASGEPCADPGLVSSAFEQAIPELSNLLVQAHRQAGLALIIAYTDLLKKEVDKNNQASNLRPDQEQA
jgi:hypothetical protein